MFDFPVIGAMPRRQQTSVQPYTQGRSTRPKRGSADTSNAEPPAIQIQTTVQPTPQGPGRGTKRSAADTNPRLPAKKKKSAPKNNDSPTTLDSLTKTVNELSKSQKLLTQKLAQKDKSLAEKDKCLTDTNEKLSQSAELMKNLQVSMDLMNKHLSANGTGAMDSDPPNPEADVIAITEEGSSENPPWPSTDSLLGKLPENLLSTDSLPNVTHKVISQLPSDARGRVAAFASSSLPVYAHVPQKVIEKIWKDEFIDMSLLMHNRGYTPEEYAFKLSTNYDDGTTPSFSVLHNGKSKKLTHAQWDICFETFHAIRTANPNLSHESSDLCAYRGTIRQLARCGADWRSFDETFRSLRVTMGWTWSKKPDDMMWTAALPAFFLKGNPEYHNQSFLSDGEQTPPWQSKKGNRNSKGVPRGLCFNFNDQAGSKCSLGAKCRYRHECRWCKESHPASKCPSKKQGNQIALAKGNDKARNSRF